MVVPSNLPGVLAAFAGTFIMTVAMFGLAVIVVVYTLSLALWSNSRSCCALRNNPVVATCSNQLNILENEAGYWGINWWIATILKRDSQLKGNRLSPDAVYLYA